MPTIDDLFDMSDRDLMKAWRAAKIAELEAGEVKMIAKGTEDAGEAAFKHAEVKLDTETIRLVISFRLTRRERLGDH